MVFRTRQTFNYLLASHDFKKTFDDKVFYNGNSEGEGVIQSKERGEIKPAGKYGQIVFAIAGLSSPMWGAQKSSLKPGKIPKLAIELSRVIKEIQRYENGKGNEKVDVDCYHVPKSSHGIGYGLVSLCSEGQLQEFERRLVERRKQIRKEETDLADALKFAEARYGHTILWLEQIGITATYEQAIANPKEEERLRISFLMNI